MSLLYMNSKKSIRKAGRIIWSRTCIQDCARGNYIRTTEIQQDTLKEKRS